MSLLPAVPATGGDNGVSADLAAMPLLAQLAARLARPVGHFADEACALPPLPNASLAAMCADPAFGAPLQRAVARGLAERATDLDAACLDRLRTRPHARLAALLVVQPRAALREAALSVAGAMVHRRVVGLILRRDRERVRAALGEAAFLIATREAPLLHAPLAETGIPVPDALFDGPEPEAIRTGLDALGLRALAAFADAVEPALGRMVRWRFPDPGTGADGAGPTPSGPALSGIHCDHIVRLLRRRMDAWSPIIA